MHEARRLLNSKELEELKWDVDEYIKYGRENALNEKWIKELENASCRFHVSRLEALKIRTQQAAEVAFGNELDAIDKMARRVFTEDYYQSIYEIQKGFNIGWDVARIDERKLNTLISKPWAADGKNFSQRIWQQKSQLINELHNQLTRACILGKAPDEAINEIARKFKTTKHQASRLVMTEQAYFHSVAQKEAFNELDVEEYEIVATLDSHTSQICREMDGKHFPMSEYKEGVTAPPFHVFCRSVTVPWFEDNFNGQRAARDEDGKTYYVPDSMTYEEWRNSFVDGGSKEGFKEQSLRTKDGGTYGVDWTIVKSKNYTERFNVLSDNEKANALAAQRSRNALVNRDGKNTEEIYAISLTTGKDISSITDQNIKFGVKKIDKFVADILRVEERGEDILLIHNHPRGLPPSVEDLNELLTHKNTVGITVGHDGSIYYYSKPSSKITNFDFAVAFKKNKKYNGVEQYEKAMEELAKQFNFIFRRL